MARTIESPGVEINEIDLSNNTNLPIGTNVLVQGFTQRGPTHELVTITSVDEFERVYGLPNTPAERYAYITARQAINSPGNLIFNRLPYGSDVGEGSDNKYTALVFPYTVVPTASATWSEIPDMSFGPVTFIASASAVHPSLSGADGLTDDLSNGEFSSFFFADSGSGILDFETGWTITLDDSSSTTGNLPYYPTTATITNISPVSTVGEFVSLSGFGSIVYYVEFDQNVLIDDSTKMTFEQSAATGYSVDFFEPNQYSGVIIGAPELFTMPVSAYEDLKEGNILSVAGSSWTNSYETSAYTFDDNLSSIANGAIILTNDNKTAIEDDFSGFYISISDNTDLDDVTYDKVTGVRTRLNGDWKDLPAGTLIPALTSEGNASSISETIETSLGFNFGQTSYNDMVKISTFRLRPDFANSTAGQVRTQLQAIFQGTVPGSLDESRLGTELTPFDPQPSSMFLNETINRSGSNYISAQVNPILASRFAGKVIRTIDALGDGLAAAGFDVSGLSSSQIETIENKANDDLTTTSNLFALGEYAPCGDKGNKTIGELARKVERGFREADNRDLIPLDIVVDGGLSTINVVKNEIVAGRSGQEYKNKSIFDDTTFIELGTLTNADYTVAGSNDLNVSWKSMYNVFETFAQDERKDCMFIMDPIRHIFVQGKNNKVIDRATASFSRDISVPLRNLVNSANSSYGALYGNWVRALDPISDTFFWAPFSGFQAAIMARTDATFFPWFAPAGLNNGLVTGIVDVAVSPNQKERDQLYRWNINPVANFPGDGFVVFGQKTLQAKPSALDRINVRRLFLTLQKATRRVARYFVFEPNTIFTRTRLVNVLTPIFENAKNNQGVFDYLIVCDERNNTPDVIDRNELVVDIYIKPVRASEFILINFIATRTGDDFSELIG